MGEPSSLTGDVGPAFPVVIPVGRTGAIEEAVPPADAANAGSSGPAGPEAEAAMWKALGDVVTTRLKLAADTLSKAGLGAQQSATAACLHTHFQGTTECSCTPFHEQQRAAAGWPRPGHGRLAFRAGLRCRSRSLGSPATDAARRGARLDASMCAVGFAVRGPRSAKTFAKGSGQISLMLRRMTEQCQKN
ncbi:unnamed protein product [Symbiodinium sp. CCMP2456]|nr:unnamed protein product [Symbiodinium sp. CCMP2456]